MEAASFQPDVFVSGVGVVTRSVNPSRQLQKDGERERKNKKVRGHFKFPPFIILNKVEGV